ncbi:siderophore-interacting protein [Myxococcus sp. K15C18031901]|uniref:siderophore-interacting protein n=1 Tax=Myxococcus dinghuensis TaxID=2906761 RepID=UPI0020A712F8|nr:siderophore-interacting protein [Myxococcus dinghuensis]MCP3101958.1 siderophore-interacting protein [Myxococcus dinghuensis]
MNRHEFQRMRHELRRRTLTVTQVQPLSPRMTRVEFAGEDLKGFVSPAFDDHIKLFFGDAMRDFTPRRFDASRGTLTIDFALHADGPAMRWVRSAKPGTQLEIGGPRGSIVVPDDFDWYLLVCDETGLPALGRKLEELRAGVPVTGLVSVASAAEEQALQTRAQWNPRWLPREVLGEDVAATLRQALGDFVRPKGEGFVWIAAESSVARAVRDEVVGKYKHPAEWVKAASYWKRGEADSHERLD